MNWNAALAEISQISRPIEEILKARQVKDVDGFLNPKMSHLYAPEFDPFNLKDMDIAVARIASAIDNDEPMMVAGDYDADGVTSTSAFVRGLEELGAEVVFDIPDRKNDGYGLSKRAVKEAYDEGIRLIITCDNGIAAVEAVDYAKSLGVDVIVTDHHEPQDVLPKAFAIVNPKQKDCPYVTKELAGCGVVFKVLQGLNQFINGDIKKAEKYLDIVCIGTIADVMKLVGENRTIVKFGLERLAVTKKRGLQSLLRILKLDDKEEISTRDIGWSVGPVLNAVGRLYNAGLAVELLTTRSKRKSWRLAKRLDEINKERQKLTAEWTKKIVEHIDKDATLLNQNVMMVPFGEDVPEGLVGLIAGKLKERYARPVILLVKDHKDKAKWKGSGRSVNGYDMFESISAHKDLLDKFGGHQAACGISLLDKNLKKLRQELNDNYDVDSDELVPKLFIDYEIEPECITLDFAYDIDKMKPFGAGNMEPLFMLRDVFVQFPKAIGSKQNHLKFVGEANDERLDMIGWSMYEKWDSLGKPRALDVAFRAGLNTWNGNTKVQLEIVDIRLPE
jgi:single-stranded-DNA-specific exonuclease